MSKTYKIILLSIGGIAVLLVVFRAGMIVGFHKAEFSYRWGENYYQNIVGPRDRFMRDFRDDRQFIGGHGTIGSIISIKDSILTVKGIDAVESNVVVKEDTVIRRFRSTLKLTDLKNGDRIVTIGSPNNKGQIEAKLIRILPEPVLGIPMPR